MSQMRIDQMQIKDADIFEILLDNFPDMIHSIDDKGDIVYTNKTAEKLLGFTRTELASMNIRQIYADEVLDLVNAGFADLKKKGDKTVESLLKAKDGTKIPVEIRSFSIYDDNGNFLRTFSILRDIRQVKELQNSLIHAGRLAAIGEMASGVAHDINNPLTVIMLSNEMAVREIDRQATPPEQKLEKIKCRCLDIQKGSKSIQKLADHLRNFSRGVAEKQETVDLYDAIADSLFIASNKVMSSRVQTNNDISKGCCFTTGCPNQLEQIFINLIGNACDAMTNCEERKLTISVSPCLFGDLQAWRCDITDTGTGIPPEIKEEIFQSFFTTKEKGKGTGLGLSISRGIAKNHKGDIQVTSELGKGTTFSVFLPRTEA